MTDLDPNKRADQDDKIAADERSEAMALYGTASNLDATAENLRKMGFDGVGDVLNHAADTAVQAGQIDMAQSHIMAEAAHHWRTFADDLDGQAAAIGAAYVAKAGAQASEQWAERATSEDERMRWEAEAARQSSLDASLHHQAADLGQDAQEEVNAALEAEAKYHDPGQ